LSRFTREATLLAIAVVAVAGLAAHAAHYLPFLSDDALITLRYADRLVAGHGLTWTDGPPVEGYSNLLWLLACAAGGAAGIDLVDAARLVGFAGVGSAAIALIWCLRARPAGAATAAFGFVACGCVAAWTVGGLEQPLVAALLAWPLALLIPVDRVGRGRALAAGALLGLLCLTRPDAALLAGAVVLALGWLGQRRAALVAAIGPAVAVGGQLAFRLAYYGDWLPNSARAKVAFTTTRIASGADYLAGGAVALAPLLAAALICMVAATRDRALRRPALLAGLPLVWWLLYLAVIGGDQFAAWRQLVPVALLAALLAGALVARLRPIWLVAAAAGLAGLIALQLRDPELARARHQQFVADGAAVGRTLRALVDRELAPPPSDPRIPDPRPTIAVTAAGSLPYYSGLPAIDMLGINDRYLATHPPAWIGHGKLGHELGSGRYVLDRAPDIVILCGPRGGELGCFHGGRELAGLPAFRDRYRRVYLDAGRVRSLLWIRLDSSSLGRRRRGNDLWLPGWLLASEPALATDSLAVTLPAGGSARLRDAVAAGRWTARVDADGPVDVTWLGRDLYLTAGARPVRIRGITLVAGR
jgi:hypothetical protein